MQLKKRIEAILAVEIRPEKNSGPNGIWTHYLCDTGVALHQLN